MRHTHYFSLVAFRFLFGPPAFAQTPQETRPTKLSALTRVKFFALTLLLLTLTSCENDQTIPRANELDVLVLRLQRELPANWSVEKNGDQIIVSRKEPITTHGCIGLDLNWLRHPELLREFVERTGVTRPYKIRLRFSPKLEFAEYRKAFTVNDRIKVTKSTLIEDREFFEDEAMQSYDPSYRELPVYFTEDSSIYVETTLHPWECIYPPVDARESEQVRLTVDSFFVRYPEARVHTDVSWLR